MLTLTYDERLGSAVETEVVGAWSYLLLVRGLGGNMAGGDGRWHLPRYGPWNRAFVRLLRHHSRPLQGALAANVAGSLNSSIMSEESLCLAFADGRGWDDPGCHRTSYRAA